MKKKNLVLSFLLVASISSAVGCSNNKSKKVSTIQSNTSSNSGAASNSEILLSTFTILIRRTLTKNI